MKKFRIWDKREERFIEHYRSKDGWNHPLFLMLDGLLGIATLESDIRPMGIGPVSIKSIEGQDTYVINQFTGLLDKNGKDIFEGDIVVCYPNNNKRKHLFDNVYEVLGEKGHLKDIVLYKGVVEYNPPKFNIKVLNKNKEGIVSTSLEYYVNEVIGDIYKNSNLLT